MIVAKRKPIPVMPTLEMRVEQLMAELDEVLDALAEERRPKGHTTIGATGETETVGGIPQALIRRMMNARGYGDCLCRTYLAAFKSDA
jgi:hypothetical protein